MHLALRIFVAIMVAGVAFVLGTYLPLSIEWILRGDPGMPGGAAMVMLGFPLGIALAIVEGLFSFVKLPARNQNPK